MSDIRFEGWLHRTGTGGVYQDSAGNVGIASTQPQQKLDIGNGGFQVGPTGITTITTLNTTNIVNGTQLSHRNLIINGAMEVAQRGTSSTSSGYQTVDRFTVLSGNTDETPTQAQVDLTSSDTPYSYGFRKALKITNGNQTSGAGANDYIEVLQKFEGQDINTSGWDFTSASSFITISFWIKSSVAQTFYGSMRITEASANKQYVFAVNATTSWQKITKTIPGASGLNPVNTNALGGWFDLITFYGTGYTGSMTPDQWNTVDTSAYIPDMTSTWYTTNDATLEYTGLQIEVGSVATPFEHRSYGDELRRCQRYFFNVTGNTNVRTAIPAFANSTTACRAMVSFPTPMRATPSFSGTATSMVFDSSDDSALFNCSTLSIGGGSNNTNPHYTLIETSTSSMTAGQAGVLEFRADNGELNFSAEL